jgi:S-adenosylmethionine hydrolase
VVEPDAVFFLSDYGRQDEFVGVVHAVLHRLAPGVHVIDVTHDVPPFDVRAGAWSLARTVPHLGPGVVLAVVDPGVGGSRRSVALEGRPGSTPRWLVGPDNGLLLPGAQALGGVAKAVRIDPVAPGPGTGDAVTFAGRDVFAPAVAALCRGKHLEDLGPELDPAELVTLPAPVIEFGRLSDGRRCLRAEVIWVDRFGNTQLAVGAERMPDATMMTLRTEAAAGAEGPLAGPEEEPVVLVRRVHTFTDLMRGELGLLADANGQLAVVLREGSAAHRLGVRSGDLVDLAW